MAHRTEEKTSSPRAEALALLLRVGRDGAYADRLLATGIGQDHNARDRAFVRELVLGVLRWQLRLDRIIDMYYTNRSGRLQDEIRGILRLGLYQLMFMDSVPDWAAVNECVALARSLRMSSAAGLVNAILRRFLREGEPSLSEAGHSERLAVRYAHPEWLVRRWMTAFGSDETELMLAAGTEKHPVTIRVNSLLTNPEALRTTLAGEGFASELVENVSGYLKVSEAGGLFTSKAFRDGLFTAQDPSAGMAVMLLDPQPGERLLDLCAAPGGKTTHIAELSGDHATIDAVDVNEARLGLVSKAVGRLGIQSVNCINGDAVRFASADGDRYYDRILCDVPCTGTAVLSKRPDMKWRREDADIGRMAELQRNILKNAAGLLRPGGIIVYSTCTMEHEENEDMMDWFTAAYPFIIEKDNRFAAYETAGYYRIAPHQMVGTGAFTAKLRYTGDE